MRVITLQCQLDWARLCLGKMKQTQRQQHDIDLQESICFTLENRIKEKANA